MVVTRTSKGNFNNLKKFLIRMRQRQAYDHLEQYGERGVEALRAATPKDSGETANSWEYKIEKGSDETTISWNNTNVQNGYFNVALGLQYGHGTGTGGWVEGQDYINPAMKAVFDDAEETVWNEITNS